MVKYTFFETYIMKLPSIITSLMLGNKLESSVTVKTVATVLNVLTGLLVAAAQAGLISLAPEQIQDASGHIQALVPTFLPYVLAFANAYAHVATSDKIGLAPKKK